MKDELHAVLHQARSMNLRALEKYKAFMASEPTLTADERQRMEEIIAGTEANIKAGEANIALIEERRP